MKEGHALHLAQKWAENARTLVTAAAARRKRTGAKEGNVETDSNGENSAEETQDKTEDLSR